LVRGLNLILHTVIAVNDALVHSKKNGEGFVDSDDKKKKVIDAVRRALDK